MLDGGIIRRAAGIRMQARAALELIHPSETSQVVSGSQNCGKRIRGRNQTRVRFGSITDGTTCQRAGRWRPLNPLDQHGWKGRIDGLAQMEERKGMHKSNACLRKRWPNANDMSVKHDKPLPGTSRLTLTYGMKYGDSSMASHNTTETQAIGKNDRKEKDSSRYL